MSRRRGSIGQVIGNLEAAGTFLGDVQVQEVLPMQQFVLRKINEGENVALRLLWLGVRCRSNLGKQLSDSDAHGFHDPAERATSETVEQDLPLVTQTDTETGFPVTVCWTARHPAMQRCTHPFQTTQDRLYRGTRYLNT